MDTKISHDRDRADRHRAKEAERRKNMSVFMDCLGEFVADSQDRKPDKLAILRIASAQIRCAKRQYAALIHSEFVLNKQPFLNNQELKHLISEIADGFLIIIQCDNGRIVYTSQMIQSLLSYSAVSHLANNYLFVMNQNTFTFFLFFNYKHDWQNKNISSFVHQDDLKHVMTQLSSKRPVVASRHRVVHYESGKINKDKLLGNNLNFL